MADVFSTNNPGFDVNPLTDAELLMVQTIAGLGDPNADRILFWDDSAGSFAYLTAGTGLTITNTTISASGSIDGSGTTNEIAYWVDADTLGALAVATYPSLAELAHVKGVTSAIQTQFTGKAATALSNLASVAINTSLVSDTDNTDALGISGTAWSDLFLGDGAVINFNAGDVTITHSANAITVAGGDLLVPDEAYDDAGWNGDLSVPTKNAIRDKIESLTGVATAWTDIGDATGDTTIALGGNFTLFTSTLDAAGEAVFTIHNTDADLANDTVLLRLDFDDNGDANAIFLQLRDEASGTPNVVFQVGADGATSMDGALTVGGTTTLATSLTGVLRADSGVVSVDADVTDIVAAGTTIAAGKLELATDAETVTGTDTARATTPANLVAKMAAPGAIGGTTPAAGTFTTLGGTTITASTGFALGDGDYVGVTGNEVLTFATAGTITLSGADWIIADGNGAVIGHTAQLVAGGITPEYQIIGTSTTNVDSTLLIANYSTTATSGAVLMLAKSDQGTPGSFALLDSGDTIGGIQWVADDGVDLTSVAASIMAFVDGSSGSNDMPGRIVFATTSDAGVAATDRWIIDSAGAFKPAADGSFDIGTTALAVNNLHLDTGATINFENGNAVITHSSAILTVSTGDLRVTTAGTNTASVVTVGGTQTLTAKTLTSPTVNASTLGGVHQLAEGGEVRLDAAGSADGAYSGITIAGTAGAALAFGDLIYLAAADSRWELADADAASTSGDVLLGMCVLAAGADGNATTVLLVGNIRADAVFPALTISAPAYVGTTAGDIQTAQPSGTDDVIRRVGFALTADELYFNPSNDYITHT